MMFRQLKVGERLQPFTGTTGQGQAAMLVIAVVDEGVYEPERSNAALTSGHRWNEYRSIRKNLL